MKPTISLFVICAVVTAALAFTYVGTKDTIAARAALDADNARKEVMADADGFETVDDLAQVTSGNPDLAIVKEAYKGMKGGAAAGYVFTVDSKGYGGDIRIIVGVDNNGKVTGVKIAEHKETPGLGTKAQEPPFMGQFDNLAPKEPLKVIKTKKTKPEEIEAISGATITSRAVVKAVQAAVDTASKLSEEGGNSK